MNVKEETGKRKDTQSQPLTELNTNIHRHKHHWCLLLLTCLRLMQVFWLFGANKDPKCGLQVCVWKGK